MASLFSLEGPVYKYMKYLYALMILNAMWMLFSIPIFTFGASTTALFKAIGRLLRDEQGVIALDYINDMKDCFKETTLIWLLLLLCDSVLCFNLMFGLNMIPVGLSWIQVPILFQLILIHMYVFLLMARFEVKGLLAIKTAWIVGNRYLLISIGVMGSSIVLFNMSLYVPASQFLLLGSLIGLMIYRLTEPLCSAIENTE